MRSDRTTAIVTMIALLVMVAVVGIALGIIVGNAT